jgi:hypothetical protein
MAQYRFGEDGSFFIEGYDKAPPFASFLPGIAGVGGVPMWAFYVNRGQAMGSFGVRDKDGAVMEFFPANTMYRNVERQGFRTFVRRGGKAHELFSSVSGGGCERTMVIRMNSLRIEETNNALGLRAAVTYFTVPGEGYAALARRLEIEGLGADGGEIEVLDGLPQILPYGVTNSAYQSASNLMRAWFEVRNAEQGAACYKVRASTGDSAEVSEVGACNFFLAFSAESRGLIPPIYDMGVLFGQNTALSRPDGWDCPLEELMQRKQIAENKVSGGFAGARVSLGKRFALYTIIGHAPGVEFVNARKARFTPEFAERKLAEAEALAESLVGSVYTKTAEPLFDRYIAQCGLDNLLRGGHPLIFRGGAENAVYHVFSRKHGDLEREYNFFSLEPGYYSQGNGNYRDVCQNRRNDVFLNPEVGDFNVRQFASLLQADGYNPLFVKGCSFAMDPQALPELLAAAGDCRGELDKLLRGRYTPGTLMAFALAHPDAPGSSPEDFVARVLARSRQEFEAEYGEGYWSDHWTYLMDLVDSYLAVFPDRKERFLFEDNSYRFFHSPVFVLPRADKYVDAGGKIRQYGSVLEEGGAKQTRWLRTKGGEGDIYETCLFSKLAVLALVKFASLDPQGMGVEMEGGRPGWNDAMNGLPGLFGSGLGETAELRRLVAFLIGACEECGGDALLFAEAAELLDGVERLLDEALGGTLGDFEYWDRVSALREEYREKTRRGIGGREVSVAAAALLRVFRKFADRLEAGMAKAFALGGGVYPTYFSWEAVRHEAIDGRRNPVNGYPCVRVKGFACRPLPLFLEGPARAMKAMKDAGAAARLYEKVRSGGIYDRALGMYKTSEPLEGTSAEVGRLMAFTPGWLERESVFVHMEYKYLYAMLKAGLHEQFFRDMRTALVPFMRPEAYGRSTLENSTFIASSVNPDESVRGRGFVARLSGSTAEMLSMWFVMMTGGEPLTVEGGGLTLRLRPILPGWLFGKDGKVSFRFLGGALVTYVNPERRDTFGEDGARPARSTLFSKSGEAVETGADIGAPYAEKARDGEISRIEVYLS